jgi:hypothetical protein
MNLSYEPDCGELALDLILMQTYQSEHTKVYNQLAWQACTSSFAGRSCASLGGIPPVIFLEDAQGGGGDGDKDSSPGPGVCLKHRPGYMYISNAVL